MRFLAILASILPVALADIYSISDTYIGKDFLTGFVHEAIGDPTHGRV